MDDEHHDQQPPFPEQNVPDDIPPHPETPLDNIGPSLGLGPPITKQFKRRALLALIILICVVAAGFGIYKEFIHHHKATTSPPPVSHVVSPGSSPSTASVGTKSYAATDYSLSFKYPDNWVIVNNGTGPMTVTSPSMQLTSAPGQKVTGQIIMTIQAQGKLPAAFSAGTALAVLNSQKVSYTKPTPSQNVQTYLSFVQYSATTTKGGLDGIYLTGNDGYQKDQVIPATDVAGVDPLITVTFTQCGNSACTLNVIPLTIASTSWSNTAFKDPIVSMFRSFAFQ